MAKFTDTQRILLSTAAQRENRSLIPISEAISESSARVRQAFASLIKATLAEEGIVQEAALAWRQEGDNSIGARITNAGRAAIGSDDEDEGGLPMHTPSAGEESRKPTKVALALAMLRRNEGATLDELIAATKWLPHTTRAALTGLRKKGHMIEKGKRGDTTQYHIASAA
jgi:hypothetical protein